MAVKVDQRTLETMARIGFQEPSFVLYLEESVAELKDSMVSQPDETQLRLLQGRAQGLMGVLDLIKTAPEKLRKA
jgi:hypothetical protein